MLYLIGAEETGPIKIGISLHVPSRLKSLQIGCPVPLHLFAEGVLYPSIEEYLKTSSPSNPQLISKRSNKIQSAIYGVIEGNYHNKFNDVRLHGEWFNLCVLDVILENPDPMFIPTERCGKDYRKYFKRMENKMLLDWRLT